MIRGQDYTVELAQVDVFGVYLLFSFLGFYFLSKNKNSSSEYLKTCEKLILWLKKKSSTSTLWIFISVMSLLFLGHVIRHLTFETHVYDMNFQHQPLFFFFPQQGSSWLHCDACRNGHLFAEHLAVTYSLLGLIAGFIRSDLLLIFIQTALVAAAIWYFLTRGPLQNLKQYWLPFLILIFLMSPFRASQNWDFREDNVGFACLLIGLTLYFNSKFWMSTLWFIAAMWSKENFPAVTFIFSALIFIKYIRQSNHKAQLRFALALGVLSLTSFFVMHKFLIPYFMNHAESKNNILRIFPVADTMQGFILYVIKNPLTFLKMFIPSVITKRSLLYIYIIISPLLVFGFRQWLWYLPGLAMAALNVLGGGTGLNGGVNHYELILLPFLFMAIANSILTEPARSQKWQLWILAFFCILPVSGRGPLFEITDRLIYRGAQIRAALELNDWHSGLSQIAASDSVLSHFNQIQNHQRLLIPKSDLPFDQLERARLFLKTNAEVLPGEQNHSIRKSTTFALKLDEPWEAWLEAELIALGGRKTRVAQDFWGSPLVSLVEIDRPFADIWCQKENICDEN